MIIKLNPNEKYVNDVKAKLKENGGYCPCRISRTPDTRCKCKEFRDMVERGDTGMCHCGLFIAEDDTK